MFTCDVDVSDFRARRAKTVELIGNGTRTAVVSGLVDGANYARRHHRHKRQTGRATGIELYSRIIRGHAKGADGELRNDVPYACVIEDGSKAHYIRPKEGHGFVGPLQAGQSRRAIKDVGTHRKALRWYVGGQPRFAAFVFHPGTSPMPFMYPAAQFAGTRIVQYIEGVVFVHASRLWN